MIYLTLDNCRIEEEIEAPNHGFNFSSSLVFDSLIAPMETREKLNEIL